MARKLRIHVPGGIYHVMLRGSAGQDIYSNEHMNQLPLLVQEGVSHYGSRVQSSYW